MTDAPHVFLASRNPKKLAEMERILRAHLPDVRVLGLDDVAAYDEPVEDRSTFSGNALLKARAGFAATGLPSIADDSGLCVDELNGMPGVLSARWSGLPKDATTGCCSTSSTTSRTSAAARSSGASSPSATTAGSSRPTASCAVASSAS